MNLQLRRSPSLSLFKWSNLGSAHLASQADICVYNLLKEISLQNGKHTSKSRGNSSYKRSLFSSCWLKKYGQDSKAGQRRKTHLLEMYRERLPGTVNTKDNLVSTRFHKNHNHPPAPSEINAQKFMAHIKERARTSLEPIKF